VRLGHALHGLIEAMEVAVVVDENPWVGDPCLSLGLVDFLLLPP